MRTYTMMITMCLMMVAYVVAEPPVDNRYLPPQGFSGSFSAPSQEYGVPNAGFGNGRQANGFRRPSLNYGPPKRPQNNYLPPSRRTNLARVPQTYLPPSNQYGPPSGDVAQPNNQYQPSNQYGTPNGVQAPTGNQFQSRYQPSNQYGAPNGVQGPAKKQFQTQYQPATQYGAPNDVQGPAKKQFQTQYQPATQYGTPNGMQAPSQEYGVPGFGRGNDLPRPDITSANFAQSRQYLPPGRGGYDDGSNGEPANYSFEYMVNDEPSGNDFGHREARQGDRAEGVYYVLLPDGRKQTVEYEADQEGYKPRISYEDTGVRTDTRDNLNDQYSSGPY